MCVIIVQPRGSHLTKIRAERLWKVNPDGGGFAYVDDDNEIQIWKSMSFTGFWNEFQNVRKNLEPRDFLLHMRIATHGSINIANVHPFKVDENNVMAHNGVINKVKEDPYKKKSDTVMFIEEILPQLPEQWLDSELFSDMVGDWLGWSKLAFLTTDPDLSFRYYIINERNGNWIDQMWFSSLTGVREPSTWEKERDKTNKERLAKANAAAKKYREENKGTTTGETAEEIAERLLAGKPRTVLPGNFISNGKSEATLADEWTEWEDEMTLEEYANLAIPLGTSDDNLEDFLGTDEAAYFLELLTEEREIHGLTMHIEWDNEGGISCYGCDEEVNLEDGTCQCWDKFCTSCEHIAGLCECKEGYSSNLKLWSELVRDRKDDK